jgi:PadR family transcriptional regulator, regulatory protein PadR
MARGPNPNFMAGVPELMILNLLREREMYGYEIVQAIRVRTSDAVSLAEGVVYPVLHQLKQEGALKSRRRTVEGRSRVYYALTARGARRFSDLTETWSRLTGAIQGMLKGDSRVKTV